MDAPLEGQAPIAPELAPNCASAALELVDAVLARRAGTVSLAPVGRAGMCADLELA
jgi:hypothetical protein